MSRTLALARLLPDIADVGDIAVSGLVLDSRDVRPGDAFVCVAGFGAHGLNFVQQARANGAVAILYDHPAPEGIAVPADAIAVPGLRARMGALADQFHGQPSRSMTMVGVTGTNGKTSTVQLLGQAWQRLGITSGSIGTLGVGLYGQVVPTGFTTPLVLQMHQVLAQLRDAGATATAMEVSSHALDQGRVDAVHYDIAVFTNLTRDHLDYHGSMDAYGAAKARLFQRPGLKAAVINLDDAYAPTCWRCSTRQWPWSGCPRVAPPARACRLPTSSWTVPGCISSCVPMASRPRWTRRCWAVSTSTTCSPWPGCCWPRASHWPSSPACSASCDRSAGA
jgi:UDP-N-acetylmuramyl tripeptide synthase